MSYCYETEKKNLFTDEGIKTFTAVRDRVLRLVGETGAIRMQEAARLPNGIGAGDSWTLLACIDKMVELGELVEIRKPEYTPGQYRVFEKGGS